MRFFRKRDRIAQKTNLVLGGRGSSSLCGVVSDPLRRFRLLRLLRAFWRSVALSVLETYGTDQPSCRSWSCLMGRWLFTDEKSVLVPPQPGKLLLCTWDIKDHSPLLDEDKFAFYGENFVSTPLSSGQMGERGNSLTSLYKQKLGASLVSGNVCGASNVPSQC